MSRTRRSFAAVALTAAVALISGCGSSAPAANNAGGGGGTASTVAVVKQGVMFAECMRRHGIENFPDPTSGKLTLDGIVNGSSLDPNSPTFTQALSACKSLEPAGFAGGKRSTHQQSAALKFARCIRANGVPDFPDPVNGQPLVDTNNIPSANQPGGKAALNAAMQKCSGLGAQARGSQ